MGLILRLPTMAASDMRAHKSRISELPDDTQLGPQLQPIGCGTIAAGFDKYIQTRAPGEDKPWDGQRFKQQPAMMPQSTWQNLATRCPQRGGARPRHSGRATEHVPHAGLETSTVKHFA